MYIHYKGRNQLIKNLFVSKKNFFLFLSYVYISAYYDAQHSLIYRSLLDGSNLETFISLYQPVLGMTVDYRHPRLYVMLSNGEIESYAIDSSQPWKTNIYRFKGIRIISNLSLFRSFS
jgi:hypothetical protein